MNTANLVMYPEWIFRLFDVFQFCFFNRFKRLKRISSILLHVPTDRQEPNWTFLKAIPSPNRCSYSIRYMRCLTTKGQITITVKVTSSTLFVPTAWQVPNVSHTNGHVYLRSLGHSYNEVIYNLPRLDPSQKHDSRKPSTLYLEVTPSGRGYYFHCGSWSEVNYMYHS